MHVSPYRTFIFTFSAAPKWAKKWPDHLFPNGFPFSSFSLVFEKS